MYTPTPLFLTAVPELTEHQISHVYPLGDGYASSDEEEQSKDIQEGDEEETDEIAAADDIDGEASFHADEGEGTDNDGETEDGDGQTDKDENQEDGNANKALKTTGKGTFATVGGVI